MRRALVEAHDAVGPERFLDADRRFGRQRERASIDVRAEDDLLVVNLCQLGQAEDLKAAAVGQDRSVPAHKPVQAAQFFDTSAPGRSAKWYVLASTICTPAAFKLLGRQPFDGGRRPDRHEGWRLDHAVRRAPQTGPTREVASLCSTSNRKALAVICSSASGRGEASETNRADRREPPRPEFAVRTGRQRVGLHELVANHPAEDERIGDLEFIRLARLEAIRLAPAAVDDPSSRKRDRRCWNS